MTPLPFCRNNCGSRTDNPTEYCRRCTLEQRISARKGVLTKRTAQITLETIDLLINLAKQFNGKLTVEELKYLRAELDGQYQTRITLVDKR
jgi:hypothetical protein